MSLQELVTEGLALVKNEPLHDLRLGFRCRLLAAIDGGIRRAGPDSGGHRLRIRLVTRTVEKVLPLWEAQIHGDRTPHGALDLVEKLLSGSISATVVDEMIGRLWTHCDNLLWKLEGNQSPVMVGYAAIQAIREANTGSLIGCEQVSDHSTDLGVDTYDHDSFFFAATAYSGGAPWEASSDPQRRLEFWTWWLTYASGLATERV